MKKSAKKNQLGRSHDDASMIDDPDQWPCWPFLPIKRKNNSLEDKNLGVLLATQEHADGKRIVYHGCLFGWPKTSEAVKALPTTEYESTQQLLADGWIVD